MVIVWGSVGSEEKADPEVLTEHINKHGQPKDVMGRMTTVGFGSGIPRQLSQVAHVVLCWGTRGKAAGGVQSLWGGCRGVEGIHKLPAWGWHTPGSLSNLLHDGLLWQDLRDTLMEQNPWHRVQDEEKEVKRRKGEKGEVGGEEAEEIRGCHHMEKILKEESMGTRKLWT